MPPVITQPLFYSGLPTANDLSNYHIRRGSRSGLEIGGEQQHQGSEYLEPLHPELSKYSTATVPPTSSQPTKGTRGRGRPAKRARGAHLHGANAAPAIQQAATTIPSSTLAAYYPAHNQGEDATKRGEIPQQIPLASTSSFSSGAIPPNTEAQNRKRRNSAVSLTLLGEAGGPSSAASLLGGIKGEPMEQIPMPTLSQVPNRKKRKHSISDEADTEGGIGDLGSPRGGKDAESFHEDQDEDYVSEESSVTKRAKTSAAPRKPTLSARTGSSHWPVLKMEPVILPRNQQLPLDASYSADGDGDDDEKRRHWGTGRKKIRIEFIENKLKRQITFSKRKSGMMKKIHELTTLTGTEALLVLVSETGHIYSYSTPRMLSLVEDPDLNPVKNALETYDDVQAQTKLEAPARSTRSGRKSASSKNPSGSSSSR